MTSLAARPAGTIASRRTLAAAIVGGFAASVALRIAVGGVQGVQSPLAGLVFAAALTALTLAAGTRSTVGPRDVLAGVAGGAVLCLPAVVARLAGSAAHTPAGSYVRFAAVVSVVAVAEEAFLRGALYGAVMECAPEWVAAVSTAVAFGLLHVPLYGWHVLPLDVAVGVWLSVLRATTGSWTGPAIAHTVADLTAWWLR